jgi:glycosyltransferase involved in cell wall biosynthesis
MEKKYRRALLLCPEKYSLFNSFHDILSEMADEVRGYDIVTAIKKGDARMNRQVFRLPFSIRKKWETYFFDKVNTMLLKKVHDFNPDLILVYNSVYLLPETCSIMKKGSKLVFFMGDSPFYTPQNNYYLACLAYADLILSPDSFWNKQLNTMGMKNTMYFIPGSDCKSYFRIENTGRDHEEEDAREILYVGSSYLNSWGYKKALLMSRFCGFNFRIFGNSAWKRWFSFFPELQSVYEESNFIPQEKLNRMFNMARLIPVDGNPGILNGVHLRLFESLSAGALPLIEYRNDVDNLLFNGFQGELPLIRDYVKAADVAAYYLNNERERSELAVAMNEYIKRHYNSAENAERLAEALS